MYNNMVQPQNYNNLQNTVDQELQSYEMLDLIRSYRVNEILNNFNILVDSFSGYLPDQIFAMSKTIEKILDIQNLSHEDFNKLGDIYESVVIYEDFEYFYELDTEDNEHKIAEIILDYDIAFWENNSNAYDAMINDFKLIYGENKVEDVINGNF
jgi:hypothetical protein